MLQLQHKDFLAFAITYCCICYYILLHLLLHTVAFAITYCCICYYILLHAPASVAPSEKRLRPGDLGVQNNNTCCSQAHMYGSRYSHQS